MASPATLDFNRLTGPPFRATIRAARICAGTLRTRRSKTLDARANRDILAAAEPLVANWRLVSETASDCLASRSKDLMLACWFTEALTHVHGFAGLRDGPEPDCTACRHLLGRALSADRRGATWEPRVAPLVWLTDADRGAASAQQLARVAFDRRRRTGLQLELLEVAVFRSRKAKPKTKARSSSGGCKPRSGLSSSNNRDSDSARVRREPAADVRQSGGRVVAAGQDSRCPVRPAGARHICAAQCNQRVARCS